MKKILKESWVSLLSLIYLGLAFSFDFFKIPNFAVLAVINTLFLLNEKTRRFLYFFFPILLCLLIYDSLGLFKAEIASNVHVNEPYELDRKLFGVWNEAEGRKETLNEFLLKFPNPAVDFICGIAYILFIFVFYGMCVVLYIKGRLKELWISTRTFISLNIIGYSTYYFYAAAPPWFVTKFGLNEIPDPFMPGSPAALIRFDELFGITFMQEAYKAGPVVYGSIPSLHVTYPLIVFLICWRLKRFRISSFLFFATVCFAAIYLNHHYVIDLLIGFAYTFAAYAFANWLFRFRLVRDF